MTQYTYDFRNHCYDLLSGLLVREDGSVVSVRRRYELMFRTLVDAMNHSTRQLTIEFAGPSARLDYLCRELHFREQQPVAYRHICAFRARCSHLKDYSETQLELTFPVDLRALCCFLGVLTGQPVPEPVKRLEAPDFPMDDVQAPIQDYLRCSVHSIEKEYVVLNGPMGESYRLPWTYSLNVSQSIDLQYLRRMLVPGSQLNLVRPREEGGFLLAEHVIFEPDLLIDISSIAKCFTEVGNTAYNYLLGRFEPQETTIPILLGNLAGQMLDEEIHHPKEYRESLSDFFAHNALQVVTCNGLTDAGTARDFHQQAALQQQNIRQMVHVSFPQDRTIDLDKIVLEPSFYCEILGLQGRMDLMQSDKHVVMEQKSGKMDEYRHRHRQPHFVQVLLYQAMLHYGYRDADGKMLRNDDISTYLLYSRYADGLIKEAPAPVLLAQALQIRNQMAYLDLLLSRGEGSRLLENLKPEVFNPEQQSGRLWQDYIFPRISGELDTIQQADPLSKKYFYRMLQFVAREHMLSKIGTSQKEASGFAALWNSTTDEKREAGNLMDNLTIDQVGENRDLIRLSVSAADNPVLPNFRIGDIVVLYSYRDTEEPDARKDMVFRASIAEMTPESITLRLRAPQKNLKLFDTPDGCHWAIEHDFIESSYNGLYRGLFSFLQANAERRRLLLGESRPRVNPKISLYSDYGEHNLLVQKAMQAEDYFLLVGPPGTGKTSFGLVNILNETLRSASAEGRTSDILLVSYTNRAVDEICSKLVKLGLPFVRIGSELGCANEYKSYLLSEQTSKVQTAHEVRNLIMGQHIVVGTTTAFASNLPIFDLKCFDLCIIDEASQILEPHLLPLLSAKHGKENAIRKFVMIGDYKQLPAVVQQTEKESEVTDESLRCIGLENCRQSLFERLIRLNPEGEVVYMLSAQGRMHQEIAAFPNKAFYGNLLTEVPLAHQQRPIPYHTDSQSEYMQLLTRRRISFLPVKKELSVDYSDKVNAREAQVIAGIVHAAWLLFAENNLAFEPSESVGVIVPYRHQIATIRKELSRFGIPELLDITIDTVERFQGSQRDIVIYGFTVSKEYQLEFLTNNRFVENDAIIDRKLNVAMTRAREILILSGDLALLSHDPLFRTLIEYVTE
ncbi:MAG: AAA family ATPase [Bacteroidales bacterium]|nr:AAA family ATPase [Bacteroidales bacterium]